jgi:hypothetical protein
MTSVVVTTAAASVVVTEGGSSTVVTAPRVTQSVAVIAEGPQGATGPVGPAGPPKSLTLSNPVIGDSITLFYTQTATTLTQVRALVLGTSAPSATIVLRFAPDRSQTGTLAISSLLVNSSTSGAAASVQNMPIPANNYVWLEVQAITGNPTELNVTMNV